MKELDYLIKFVCIYGVSLLLIFQVGPYFLSIKKTEQDRLDNHQQIGRFEINHVHPLSKDTNYLRLYTVIDQKIDSTPLFLKDHKYTGLRKFLNQTNSIDSFSLGNQLPIRVSLDTLRKYSSIQTDKGRGILIFNSNYI